MTLSQSRINIFNRIKTDFDSTKANLLFEGDQTPIDLEKNFIKIAFEVLSTPRVSLGTDYSQKINVSAVATIYSLQVGGFKSGLVNSFTDTLQSGVTGLVLDSNFSTQYLRPTKTHEKTRVIAYFYFIRQNQLLYT